MCFRTEEMIQAGVQYAISKGLISSGETYLTVYGSSSSVGSTDQMRVSIA